MAAIYKVLDDRDRKEIDASINQLTNKVYKKETNLQNNIDNLESRHEELKAYAETNKKLIDKLDEDKINYRDIVNTINSELADSDAAAAVPLSAAQGGILYNRDQLLQTQINTNKDSINTEKSRATSAETGLDNRLKVVEKNVNTFLSNADFTEAAKDTLREIQDYINSDTSAAADMTASIQANANAISAEVTRATGAESELDAAITAEKSRALGIESGLNTRLTNVENNKVNTADIVNDLTTGGTTVPLSAEQGKVLNNTMSDAIALRIPKSAIIDNLTDGGSTKVLSAEQGKVLEEKKINYTDIIDNLTSTDTDKPLSANQGKLLNNNLSTIAEARILKTSIADNLTTTDATKVLSAKQGNVLDTKKVNVSDIVNDLTTGGTTVPLSAEQGKVLNNNLSTIAEARILKTSIADDLITNDATKVLSAKQGFVLKGLYDNIPKWALAANKPTYTYTEVGADANGAATSAVNAHNTSESAHSDIREAVTNVSSALSERIPKSAIIDDIVNDTSNRTGKVLSAGQGDMLYELIQDLITRVEALEGSSTTTE